MKHKCSAQEFDVYIGIKRSKDHTSEEDPKQWLDQH